MKNIKKSYVKIFLFEIISLFILLLNSFRTSTLMTYREPLFLLILNFIFVLMLGVEKRNNRYSKLVIFEIIRGSIIFLLVFYLSGLLITFARVDDYLTLYGFTTILLPLVLTIIFKEYLRNSILIKSGDNKTLIVLTTIMFIMIDVATSLSIVNLNKSGDIFLFISCTLLPAITSNIFLTYIVKKVGYTSSIIYLFILNLYQYIIPIIPNPSRYIKSIIDLLLPVLFMIRIISVLDNPHLKQMTRDEIKNNGFIYYIIPITLTIIFVYFISGYFKYYTIAVASGSMKPEFDRGSVVVLERIDDKYKNKDIIKEGSIIAFRVNKQSVIIHRVNKIVTDGDNKYYYTKGDANKSIDNGYVEIKDIIGVVKVDIPYIGYPTVWLSEN